MTEPDQQFLLELAKELGKHSDKEEILADYEAHIHELLIDEPIDDAYAYDELVKRLGSPQEIAKMWKIETGVTPRKTQWLFIICNILIFIGGAIIVICYHIFDFQWLKQLWSNLSESMLLIMFIYSLFWGLLGYEIGKEFGHRGRSLLKRTFFISI